MDAVGGLEVNEAAFSGDGQPFVAPGEGDAGTGVEEGGKVVLDGRGADEHDFVGVGAADGKELEVESVDGGAVRGFGVAADFIAAAIGTGVGGRPDSRGGTYRRLVSIAPPS